MNIYVIYYLFLTGITNVEKEKKNRNITYFLRTFLNWYCICHGFHFLQFDLIILKIVLRWMLLF